MRRQNTVQYLLLGGVVLAAVACGSYDHKEQYSKVQQRLECWGSGDCTWAEEGNYCVVPPSNGQLAYTLFCSSCKVVTAEAVGKYEKPGCKPDAGAGGTSTGGAGGTTTGGAGGTPTGGSGGTPPCTDGQQINCGCAGGFQGIQVCKSGVYGPCDCDGGAGGTSTGGSGGTTAGGSGGTATGGSAGEAGSATGGAGGTGGTDQDAAAGAGGTTAGGSGGTSTGGSGGTVAGGSAGEAGSAGTSTGGTSAGGAGGTPTGGSGGTDQDAGTCNANNLPTSCTTALGTACANKFEDAPNCNGLVRCGCTDMWVLTCATDNFTCSCHGGDLCSNWGWSEGYMCTELDPGGDGGTRTLTCQCNVMLDEAVVCVNPPDGGTAGTGGTSTGGSGGTSTGGSGGTSTGGTAGNAGSSTGGTSSGGAGGTTTGGSGGTAAGGSAGAAGSATGGAGGSGGTSTGGSGGTATGGSGGALPDASTSLNNPMFLTNDPCSQIESSTSPVTLPAIGLWLQYQAPIKLPNTLLGEYDWTNFTTPGYTDTNWQIRTATATTAETSIFTLLVNTPGLAYDRWFMVKQIEQLSTQNCLFYNNDGYYCNYTPDASQTGTLYCSGTWTLWLNNASIATYTDAAGKAPSLPFIKTFTFKDGVWAPKIGVRLPLAT